MDREVTVCLKWLKSTTAMLVNEIDIELLEKRERQQSRLLAS